MFGDKELVVLYIVCFHFLLQTFILSVLQETVSILCYWVTATEWYLCTAFLHSHKSDKLRAKARRIVRGVMVKVYAF
jgi:hypothetical protein